jgi:hypothetical protein
VDIKKLNPKLEKSSNAKQFQSAQMKPREFTKKAQTEHFSDFQQNVKGQVLLLTLLRLVSLLDLLVYVIIF